MAVAPRRESPAAATVPSLVPAPNEKLRVLFFAWNYYPAPAGGAERQARLQAEELVRRGHEVTVVCPRVPGVAGGVINGVRVRRLLKIYRRPLGRVTYLSSILRFMLVHARRYDVVHIHLANLQADVVVPIAKMLRKPVYSKVACGGEIGEVMRLRNVARVTRWVGLRKSTLVQALSAEIATELESIGVAPDRIVHLPNGLDLGRFRPATPGERADLRAALGLPRDKTLVLFAGRFARYKGIDDLLAVWKEVARSDACLVLVGSAETDHPLDALPEGDGVIVRGWSNQVVDFVRASDVFVYPSWTDGMSNAVLEALACGLAVVASTSGATAEMVEDGVEALLFAPRDRALLRAQLVCVLGDAELRRRLGRAAAAGSAARGIDRVVDRLEASYRRMLADA
jgi:glycosyltransferase involved in cell wall biosynthesis